MFIGSLSKREISAFLCVNQTITIVPETEAVKCYLLMMIF